MMQPRNRHLKCYSTNTMKEKVSCILTSLNGIVFSVFRRLLKVYFSLTTFALLIVFQEVRVDNSVCAC